MNVSTDYNVRKKIQFKIMRATTITIVLKILQLSIFHIFYKEKVVSQESSSDIKSVYNIKPWTSMS